MQIPVRDGQKSPERSPYPENLMGEKNLTRFFAVGRRVRSPSEPSSLQARAGDGTVT